MILFAIFLYWCFQFTATIHPWHCTLRRSPLPAFPGQLYIETIPHICHQYHQYRKICHREKFLISKHILHLETLPIPAFPGRLYIETSALLILDQWVRWLGQTRQFNSILGYFEDKNYNFLVLLLLLNIFNHFEVLNLFKLGSCWIIQCRYRCDIKIREKIIQNQFCKISIVGWSCYKYYMACGRVINILNGPWSAQYWGLP